MSNIFEYIKNAFVKSPLGDQDWLEPSDQVLSNIEAAISEDDKNYRPILVLFFLGLLMVGGVLVLFFSNPDKQKKSIDEEPQQNKVEQNKIEKNKASQTLVESAELLEVDLQNVNKTQIAKINQKASDSSIVSKRKEANRSQEENEQQILNSVNWPSNSDRKIQNVNIESNKLIKGSENTLVQNRNKVVFADQQEVRQLVPNMITPHSVDKPSEVIAISSPNYLPAISLVEFDEKAIDLSIIPNDHLADLDIKTFTPKFFIETGVGVTSWDFRLNDEYEDLLESAAFENSNGVGYATYLKIGRDLNPRLSLSLEGGYESISFNSGHNSRIVYDNNLTEQFQDLTIATPLGLVNNQVALLRMADGNRNQTDLLVELENEHRLTAVELSLKANFTLVQINKFSFIISPGIGVQQILSTENELISLITNHAEIANGGSVAEGSFESVKNTSPFTSLHFAAQMELSDHWQVGLRLGSSLQFSPIQETMDLKTNVIRYNTQLVLRKSF